MIEFDKNVWLVAFGTGAAIAFGFETLRTKVRH